MTGTMRVGKAVMVSVFGLIMLASVHAAEEADSLVDAITGGKASVNARLRFEHAERTGSENSEALTLRTRLGYSTKTLKGLRGFVEYEDVTALSSEDDYNSAGLNTNALDHTVIADPETLELNQAYLEYAGLDSIIRGGRQRIILGNARFVGNVGWRQNEQTYNAASLQNGSVKGIDLYYAYIDGVYRIFGQENGAEPAGSAGNAARYDSESHAVNVAWSSSSAFSATAYAYLLDLGEDVGAANSSDTYGASAAVSKKLDSVSLAGTLEYAQQSDNSATTAEKDYSAEYLMLDINGSVSGATLGLGYELLGSDNGASFGTPLATAHKFNGWADVFLATPAAGLEDMYAYVGYSCPEKKGKIKAVYHDFASDTGDIDYGTELDIVVSMKVAKNVTAIAKYSDYNADGGEMVPASQASDVERISVEASLVF
jgi:hypothetical protein